MASMKTIALALTLLAASATYAEPIRILSWNVESDGSDPGIIAKQLAELDRADVYCLQEVSGRDIARYGFAIRNAHGKAYRFIASNTGGGDRLAIVYDSDRLAILESRELFQHENYVLNSWRHRSPLVMVLRERETGKEFNVMTVHLARGDRKFRREQAEGLREWAKAQERPTLAVGDFNFDYDFPTKRGNRSFGIFTANHSPWRWIKPIEMIDTNWSDDDGDGRDNYPDSMLDFAFEAGEGESRSVARVIVRDRDFPDTDKTSDHRPIAVEWSVPQRSR